MTVLVFKEGGPQKQQEILQGMQTVSKAVKLVPTVTW